MFHSCTRYHGKISQLPILPSDPKHMRIIINLLCKHEDVLCVKHEDDSSLSGTKLHHLS